MGNRIDTKIVLGSKRFKSAIDTDLSLQVPLDNTQKEMDEFDRSNVVSLAEIFDEERQSSNTFRLTANIDLLFYNAYSGISQTYIPFTNYLYYINSENSFNTNSWSGYPQYAEFDLIRFDNEIPGYTSGTALNPPHVQFINQSAATYNWTQYISYAYENDYNKTLQYYINSNNSITWTSGDGIPFYIINPFYQNGRAMVSFVCPVEHNLSEGEWVQLEISPSWNGYNGNKLFQVYSLGNNAFGSEKYVFNIYNNGFTGTSFSNGNEGTLKRIIDINNSAETMSKYYVRKHRIITNVADSILTKAGFDQNGFGVRRQYETATLTPNNVSRITQKEGNQSFLLSFSKDIDISQYRDNLNRPISELYFTIINKGYFGWMNLPYANGVSIRQGYKYNLTSTVSKYWSLSNLGVNLSNIKTMFYNKPGGFTFFYNKDLKSGDTLDGAFCEFNQFEQQERVLSEIYHKIGFNPNLFVMPTQQIFGVPNPNGYYYQPHHEIKLRIYSDYLEEGDVRGITDFPDYAYYSNYKNKLIWRDLYTYGFIDEQGNGVDYPFLNGTHYPSTKIIFRVFPEGNVSENISAIADPIIDDCE